MKIRIGSRESALAVAQARILMDFLENTGVQTELVTMKTTGDMILDMTLDKIGGKGLFVKELDGALLAGDVDLTIHSYKDMPMETDDRLPVIAVSRREDPRDALILPPGAEDIDITKPIGCSSARRTIQLRALYPWTSVAPLRGNVLTRLKKLDGGEYSAIVLALAGLKRLGLDNRVSRIFEPDEMIPASCQGILAVQSRSDFDRALLAGFHDGDAYDASVAERGFTSALGGGCSSPVAAYATVSGSELTLTGLYVDDKGAVHTGTLSGKRADAADIGKTLATDLKGGTV